MKNKIIFPVLFFSILLILFACRKEEVRIPPASTVAEFTVDISNKSVAPAVATVINKSINAAGYRWDFGNGITSTEDNPAPVNYDEPGTYVIRLEVDPVHDVYYNKLVKEITVVITDPNAGKLKTLYYTTRQTGKAHYVRLDTLAPVVFDFPTGGLYKPYGMTVDIKNEKVYVTDTDGYIYRYDLDGGNQEVVLSEAQEPMVDAPYGILVIHDKIYWSREGGIFTANLDGSGAAPFLESSGAPEMPLGMAYDSLAGKIYFVNDKYDFSGGVYTINLDGTGLTQIIPGVDAGAISLDLVNGKLYYADWVGGVFMANLDGSDVVNINPALNNKFCWGIAVDPDNGYLYVPDKYDNVIIRSALDGSSPEIWLTNANAHAMVIDIYR